MFWGMLAVYLMRVVNPKVDKALDWVGARWNIKALKTAVVILITFLFLDFLISTVALDTYLVRTTVENNLEVTNMEETLKKYNFYFKENEKLANIINTLWGDRYMVKIYPNVTIKLANGEAVYACVYHKDIEPYFIRFRNKNIPIRNVIYE